MFGTFRCTKWIFVNIFESVSDLCHEFRTQFNEITTYILDGPFVSMYTVQYIAIVQPLLGGVKIVLIFWHIQTRLEKH